MSDPSTGIEFNVGVDVEDIARFERDDVRLDALFTADELAEAATVNQATRLTGTWCAKEATVKALWPWVRLDPRRVAVSRDGEGRPRVTVSGWDQDAAGVGTRVSISHTSTVATAVVLAWGPPTAQSNAHEGDGVR